MENVIQYIEQNHDRYLEELSEVNDEAWLYAFSGIKPDSSTKKVLGEMEDWRRTAYTTLINYLPKK